MFWDSFSWWEGDASCMCEHCVSGMCEPFWKKLMTGDSRWRQRRRSILPILTHCCKSVPAEGMICWWTSFIQLMFCSINCFSWRGGYSNLLWWSVSGHQPKYLWQPSVHWVMVQMGVKTEGSCQYWHLIALGVTNIWQYFTIFRWPIFDFLPILTPDSVGGWPDHWL